MILRFPMVRLLVSPSPPEFRTRALLRALRILRALFLEAPSSLASLPGPALLGRGVDEGLSRPSPPLSLVGARPASFSFSASKRRSRSSVTELKFNLKRGARAPLPPRPPPPAPVPPPRPPSGGEPLLTAEASKAAKALPGPMCRGVLCLVGTGGGLEAAAASPRCA
jgi:hypothetical protein